MKKILSLILSLVLTLTAFSCLTTAAGAASGYGILYPSQEEIIAKAEALGIDLSAVEDYSEDFSLDPAAYAAGALTEGTQENALKLLNFYRYIAGLPDDVEIDSDYTELAQAAALVNAANGTLSHYPDRPEGMSDTLYELGSQGARSANIAAGFDNIPLAMCQGWMDDSNVSNIAVVGHRRWVLNPAMKATGFGAVGSYQAMYAHDTSRGGSFTGDYVAWPAPNTPIELFSGSVFSISLGSEYDPPSEDKVTVEVSSQTLNKSWTVSRDSQNGFLSVDNNYYGTPKCIIFKVTDFSETDTVRVRISGVTKSGQDAPIEYTVNLFTLTQASVQSGNIALYTYDCEIPEVTVTSPLFREAPYLRWVSSDNSVAGIYYLGDQRVIYALKEGTAFLECYLNDLRIVRVRVTVSDSDIILGDADADGAVSVIDVTVIQRQLAGMDTAAFREAAADADCDGDLSVVDASFIQRYLALMQTVDGINTVMQRR